MLTKEQIRQEAERLYPFETEGYLPERSFNNARQAARREGYIAAALKQQEPERGTQSPRLIYTCEYCKKQMPLGQIHDCNDNVGERNTSVIDFNSELKEQSPPPTPSVEQQEEEESEVDLANLVQELQDTLNFDRGRLAKSFEKRKQLEKEIASLNQKIVDYGNRIWTLQDELKRADSSLQEANRKIEFLEEQLEGSRVVYEYGPVKITEADQAQWHAEDAQHLRETAVRFSKRIEELENRFASLQSSQAEVAGKVFTEQEVTFIRNRLYDMMPNGHLTVVGLSSVVARYLKEFDQFIDDKASYINSLKSDKKENI
jgi:DNA repair exonuclease SbcCD ATPase subunit